MNYLSLSEGAVFFFGNDTLVMFKSLKNLTYEMHRLGSPEISVFYNIIIIELTFGFFQKPGGNTSIPFIRIHTVFLSKFHGIKYVSRTSIICSKYKTYPLLFI